MSTLTKDYHFIPEEAKTEEEPIIPSPREVWRGLSLAFSQAQSMHAWLEAGVPVEQAHEIVFGRRLKQRD